MDYINHLLVLLPVYTYSIPRHLRVYYDQKFTCFPLALRLDFAKLNIRILAALANRMENSAPISVFSVVHT